MRDITRRVKFGEPEVTSPRVKILLSNTELAKELANGIRQAKKSPDKKYTFSPEMSYKMTNYIDNRLRK
jgi:hypothetical protein